MSIIQGQVIYQPIIQGQVIYYPIAQAYPIFQNVLPKEPPKNIGKNISPELWGIIESSNVYTVRKHLKVFPKFRGCCQCPPCSPQEETFSVYVGPSNAEQHEILRFDEVSDDWNRCCCKPLHPFKLEAKQHIPFPGDVDYTGGGDLNFLQANLQNDWNRLVHPNARERAIARKELYSHQPTLFTIVRDDGQRCCYKCPCKCYNSFVCFDFCQEGVHIYAGKTEDGVEKGRPFNENPDSLIGSVIQPILGGCCIPYLLLKTGPDSSEPFGKLAGPCCFGGWSEMCFDFRFNVSKLTSDRSSGDIAVVTKVRPKSATAVATTLCCNDQTDVFSIEFKSDPSITTEQKIAVFSSQILIDYMIFDGRTEKCTQDDSAVYCHLWFCFVIGQLIPCTIIIPKQAQ